MPPLRILLALLILPALGHAQTPAAGLLYVVGADTIGIERFTRTAGGVEGDIELRGQPRYRYVAPLLAGATQGTLNFSVSGAGVTRVQIRMRGDSAIVQISARGQSTTQRLLSRAGAFPTINSSIGLLELAIAPLRQRAWQGEELLFFTAGGRTVPLTLTPIVGDSLAYSLGPQRGTAVIDSAGRILRWHVPAQRLTVIRIDGVRAEGFTLHSPDYTAPAGAPYSATAVTVPTPAGHILAGTFTRPLDTARVAAVVTITGSGPQDRDEAISVVPGYRLFRDIADTLSRRGIAVLRLDDRGVGASGGTFASATSADFADDVRSAVTWLRARADVDPDRIVLVGHSEGGLIAPLVAATDPRLAGIVLMAGPAQTGRRIIEYQMRQAVDNDTSVAPGARDSVYRARMTGADSTAFREPWMRDFLAYDPLPALAQVKMPVLILQGATDRQVTADQAVTILGTLRQHGNRRVTLQVFPARNHLFLPDPDGRPGGYAALPTTSIGPEVLGPLADWIAEQTGSPRH